MDQRGRQRVHVRGFACVNRQLRLESPRLEARSEHRKHAHLVVRSRVEGAAVRFLLLGMAVLASPPAQAEDCIDYGDYLKRIGGVDTPGDAWSLAVAGSYAYVAASDAGLQVVDISHPRSPTIIGSTSTSGNAKGVAVAGSYAYVAAGDVGLQVIDISDPSSPVVVSRATMPGYAIDIAMAGSYAFVAANDAGLQIIDISDPTAPMVIGSKDTPGYARGVAVAGSYVYIADSYYGLQVIDVSTPTLPSIVGSAQTPGLARAVAVIGSYAYVADSFDGLQAVDISNSSLPTIVRNIGTPGREARDVVVAGSLAYVAEASSGNDSDSGLLAVDISCPASPAIVGRASTLGDALVVAVEGSYAYVAGASPSRLEIIDLSSPRPIILGSADTSGEAAGVAVAGSYAYVAVSDGGLRVIDVSSPAAPAVVGSIATPGRAIDVAVAGSYAYIVGDSGLHVIVISDPTSPTIVGSIGTTGRATGVAVTGSHAYVVVQDAILQVINISNPTSPMIVGSLGTGSSLALDVAVAGSYAYLASVRVGGGFLQVIDISNPASPRIVGAEETRYPAMDVAVSGDFAYVATSTRLDVIDVSNPASPAIVGWWHPSLLHDPYYDEATVALDGAYAYLATRTLVGVIDISNPARPSVIGRIYTPGEANGVAVTGRCACIADGTGGLAVLPVQCGGPAPDLTLGVLQNPYLTQILDLYLVSSVPLDTAAVQISGLENGLSLDMTDAVENVWVGHYELTDYNTTVSLLACASSRAGRTSCVERAFSASLLRRGVMGTVMSPDGRVTLSVHQPGLGRDAYLVVLPQGGDVDERSYEISPRGILGGLEATIEMRFPGAGVADPTGLYIEEQSRGSLESFVDPVAQTVTATVSELGTFRLVRGRGGSSPIENRRLLKVEQNVPNPFNPRTTLRFAIGARQQVRVNVYDALGKEVATLMDRVVGAGVHEVVWDGRSAEGSAVASGVYLYRVEAEEASVAQKMLLVK